MSSKELVQSSFNEKTDRRNRILIVEHRIPKIKENFDHVFSFFPNNADSFPSDYLDLAQYQEIYYRVYEAFLEQIENNAFREFFSYRGVDLLWCFKKKLFNYANDFAIRYAVLSKIAEKYGPADFCIEDSEVNVPTRLIYENSSLKSVTRMIDIQSSQTNRYRTGNGMSWSRGLGFWPSRIGPKTQGSLEYLLFSDFSKVRRVSEKLNWRNVAFYTDVKAPRLFLQSRLKGFGFYQYNYQHSADHKYKALASEFIERLKTQNPFTNSGFDGFDAGKLLGLGLESLFRPMLPKLLYDIDALFRLFNGQKAIRSILLDEDVAPTKNAACQIARLCGVRSFVECHGALGEKSGFAPVTADIIFVWGTAQKVKLAAWGVPEEKIIVSGCTRYTAYLHMNKREIRERVVRDMKLDCRNKLAVIAFPPIKYSRLRFFEQKWKEFFYEVLQVVSSIPDVQFLIKIKRKSDCEVRNYSEKWISDHQLEKRLIIVEDYDPLLLAKAADFLIVYGSTLAVEGFAMGTPVIWLHDEWSPLLVEYRKYQVLHYAEDKRSLANWIKRLCEDVETLAIGDREGAYRDCLNRGQQAAPEDVIAFHLKQSHL
ncbi:MAG: hypothetical protein JW893_03720 [Candidatus Omnitrophica bacterium]|nr:hypothetical protein [Candidatus Omnitrophota bacterium]